MLKNSSFDLETITKGIILIWEKFVLAVKKIKEKNIYFELVELYFMKMSFRLD